MSHTARHGTPRFTLNVVKSPPLLYTKEGKWDEAAFGVKQWQAICAILPTTQYCMTHAAHHCFTPNRVSSHFFSFAPFPTKFRSTMSDLICFEAAVRFYFTVRVHTYWFSKSRHRNNKRQCSCFVFEKEHADVRTDRKRFAIIQKSKLNKCKKIPIEKQYCIVPPCLVTLASPP